VKWPGTEYVVFGLLGAMLLAVKWAQIAAAVLGKRAKKREPTPEGLGRGFGFMSLLCLVFLVLVAAYFWFLDPASEGLREWLGGMGGEREP